MSLNIRPGQSTDLSRLMGMDHTCVSEYVWQVDLRREPGQISTTLREVRLPRPITVPYPRNPYALADEWHRKAAILVAVDPDPVGYALIAEQSQATVAWITDLVVAREKRRTGVGFALLASAESWAVARGCRMMIFEVQAKNQPAIRLAQKFGLEYCGYNDHYYANRDVALFFGRSLQNDT